MTQGVVRVRTTDEQRNKLREALVLGNAARNEVVWTYLVADVVRRIGDAAVAKLFGAKLTGSVLWFEAQPLPPRDKEGNTCLDLAGGAIRRRPGTASGIELDPESGLKWVGFVEAKVRSDCSIDVAYDPTRNQLVRVIENLLTFQGTDRFPEALHFTLLTPTFFRDRKHRRTRLYGYKFDEYAAEPRRILDDLELSRLDRRAHAGWRYPADIEQRLDRLQLHWATYEDVLCLDPELADVDVIACTEKGVLPDVVRQHLNAALADSIDDAV